MAADDQPPAPGNPRQRFRKRNRLLDAAAFTRVFRMRSRSRDEWFTVISRPNGLAIARLGLAISKRHCRRATARNRIKRIVRESFRENQSVLAGLDLVVINQPAAGSGSNRQLFDSLAKHWRKCADRQRQQSSQARHDG